ncbi:phosphatidylinositol 4-kinase alpha-related [Anaeramoeba ignava]|uniref:1-phosphatidylinositol 4-kinase n=1 Tax=Anaeramoeba ignava TaxID=1746090 RepID=A0A9Q0R6V1_ANAIG|nr:phosphatidylinositol 4-kinase alpha-related [Anaeramoeba ignava]|eukprot:Anaeramoba_ignava/a348213_120.p1 GENE.a348213_120~~a348213_120.p1  ORF type:complete len:2418 (-),score=594.36 a348213_120:38-7291(-)
MSSFHSKALNHLAKALAYSDPPSKQQVESLISLCSEYQSAHLDKRWTNSVMALANFLRLSKGMYLHEILPLILGKVKKVLDYQLQILSLEKMEMFIERIFAILIEISQFKNPKQDTEKNKENESNTKTAGSHIIDFIISSLSSSLKRIIQKTDTLKLLKGITEKHVKQDKKQQKQREKKEKKQGKHEKDEDEDQEKEEEKKDDQEEKEKNEDQEKKEDEKKEDQEKKEEDKEDSEEDEKQDEKEDKEDREEKEKDNINSDSKRHEALGFVSEFNAKEMSFAAFLGITNALATQSAMNMNHKQLGTLVHILLKTIKVLERLKKMVLSRITQTTASPRNARRKSQNLTHNVKWSEAAKTVAQFVSRGITTLRSTVVEICGKLVDLPQDICRPKERDRFGDIAEHILAAILGQARGQKARTKHGRARQLSAVLELIAKSTGNQPEQMMRSVTVLSEILAENRKLVTVLGTKKDDKNSVNAVLHTAIKCLSLVGQREARVSRVVVDALKTFLVSTPNPAFVELASDEICAVFRDERTGWNVQGISSFISSLSSELFGNWGQQLRTDTPKVPGNALVNIVIFLGKLSCEFGSIAELVAMVIKLLVSRLCNPKHPVDAVIVNQLTRIALIEDGQTAHLSKILSVFETIIKNSGDDRTKIARDEIPQALLQIAARVKAPRAKNRVLVRLVQLFIHKCEVISREATKQGISSSAMAADLGVLLPAIAAAVSGFREMKKALALEPTYSTSRPAIKYKKMFRSFWFYCVLHGFVVDGLWFPEWFAAITTVAQNIPALANRHKAHGQLEIGEELHSILDSHSSIGALKELRASLIGFLPKEAAIIAKLQFAQCTYLLAVYHLETLRAEHGAFHECFAYLEDEGIQNNQEHFACIKSIIDRAFSLFLGFVERLNRGEKRDNLLDYEAQFLLVNFCSRLKRVRLAAYKFIIQLVQRFPHILWSKCCLRTLLDLLEATAYSCEIEQIPVLRSLDSVDSYIKSVDYDPKIPNSGQTSTPQNQSSQLTSSPDSNSKTKSKSKSKTKKQKPKSKPKNKKQKSKLKSKNSAKSLAIPQQPQLQNQPQLKRGTSTSNLMQMPHSTLTSPLGISANGINSQGVARLLLGIGQNAYSAPQEEQKLSKFKLPHSQHTLDLLVGLSVRKEMYNSLKKLSAEWLRKAVQIAPTQIFSLTHEFINDFIGSNFVMLKHRGVGLLLDIIAETISPDAPQPTNRSKSQSKVGDSLTSEFVSAAELKSRFLGEIVGIQRTLDFLHATRNITNLSIPLSLSELLCKELSSLLSSNLTPNKLNSADLGPLFMKAAAFIVAEKRFDDDLLHYICWVPPHLFTSDAMSVGTFVWSWIAAERPDLEIQMMSELSAAWERIANQHAGIFYVESDFDPNSVQSPFSMNCFSDDENEVENLTENPVRNFPQNENIEQNSPLDQNTDLMGDKKDIKQGSTPNDLSSAFLKNAKPHTLWIQFLIERFEVVRRKNKLLMHVFQRILQRSFADPLGLSKRQECFPARMQLALLGLKYVQGDYMASRPAKMLLRKWIYRTILDWFSLRPIWHTLETKSSMQKTLGILTELAQTFQQESLVVNSFKKDYLAQSPIKERRDNDANINTPLIGGTSFDADNLLGFENMGVDPQTTQSNPQNYFTVTSSSLSVVMSVTKTMSMNKRFQDNAMLDETSLRNIQRQISEMRGVLKLIKLILFFLGDEIERISVWFNPRQDPELQFPDEKKYVPDYVALSTRGGSELKKMVTSAWQINPALAVSLSSRLNIPLIHDTLRRMVREHPLAVCHLHDAFQFLVDERSVTEDIPELHNLVFFPPVSPALALSLLVKPFSSHSLVAQYATHVLASFEPQMIIFFLPQIVQSLRYDRSGFVFKFLLEAASKSFLVAHQLIWNCQAESQSTTVRPNDVLKPLALRLISEITSSFTLQQAYLYQSEFSFINRFTHISGILKPFKTKQERKAKIREQLKLIQIVPNLYLPTNPESRVVRIHCDSGIPLPSHAKVPIMVTFRVQYISIAEQMREIASFEPPKDFRFSQNSLLVDIPDDPNQEKPNHIKNNSNISSEHDRSHEKSLDADKSHHSETQNLSNISDITDNSNLDNYAHHRSQSLVVDKNFIKDNPDLDFKNIDEDPLEMKRDSNLSIDQEKQVGNNFANMQSQTKRREFDQKCIFKSGDDIRQDMLALQIISFVQKILKSVNLKLFLYPYKVIATGDGCGIIECVKNSKSRDQLGKETEGSLFEHFKNKYGHEDSPSFRQARNNFIESMAAYSVASFLLQIKDRHNGNIMVDNQGHVIHIDFGFIFDISPGGDMKFERAPFKLSHEMIQIMGGSIDAEPFKQFMDYCCRAYLALRPHMKSFLAMVSLMFDTGLPCFKENTLKNFRERFTPDKTPREAAQFMIFKINESFNQYSTLIYDQFQAWQNGIAF